MNDWELIALLAVFALSTWAQVVLCGWLEGGKG